MRPNVVYLDCNQKKKWLYYNLVSMNHDTAQWRLETYFTHFPDWDELLRQPHEHVGQGTIVLLWKDESERQQVGVLWVRNCEYLHTTCHVTAINNDDIKDTITCSNLLTDLYNNCKLQLVLNWIKELATCVLDVVFKSMRLVNRNSILGILGGETLEAYLY